MQQASASKPLRLTMYRPVHLLMCSSCLTLSEALAGTPRPSALSSVIAAPAPPRESSCIWHNRQRQGAAQLRTGIWRGGFAKGEGVPCSAWLRVQALEARAWRVGAACQAEHGTPWAAARHRVAINLVGRKGRRDDPPWGSEGGFT